mgnify:CR=1 FL=1
MRYLKSGTYTDGQGNVIASGTVVVYLAGTTTDATWYTVVSGGVAVTSTTTGTNGGFSIYIDPADYPITSQLFDIKLSKTNYSSVTISNVPLLPPDSSDIRIKSISGKFIDDIFDGGYDVTGKFGSVISKFPDVDAASYFPAGYVTDGSVDYTTQLQNAINYAATNNLNLRLPQGRFLYSKLYLYYDVTLNPGFPSAAAQKGKLRIFGVRPHYTEQLDAGNYYGTVLDSNDATGPALSIVDANYVTTGLYIENLSLIATNTTQVLLLDHINNNCNLNNVAVLQKGTGGGILAESVWVNHWQNVDIMKTASAQTGNGLIVRAVSGETGGGNSLLINVSVADFDKNWEIGHATGNGGGTLNTVTCLSCQSSNAKTYGVLVGHGAAGVNWITSYIESTHVAGNTGIGFWVKNKASDVRINGSSWFSGNDIDIQLGDGTASAVTDVFRHVNIEDNIFSVRGTGIKVYSTVNSYGAKIKHNRFDENASPNGATIGIDLQNSIHHGLEVESNTFGMLAALDTNITNANRINIYRATTATGEISQLIDGYVGTLANSATPSVLNGRTWLTGGTTTITNFTDGVAWQKIEILAEHAITITDGTNIFLNGSVNFVMASSDSLELIQKADGKWYEQGRSDNT